MLEVNNNYRGGFSKNLFKIGVSIDSPYVPFINVVNKEFLITREKGFMYHKPDWNKQNGIRISRSTLINNLNERQEVICAKVIKSPNEYISIGVGKGYIVDEKDNILLLLGVKQEKINDMSFFSTNPDSKELSFAQENLVLFISSELMKNKTYSALYKILEKEYIKDAYSYDIDVLITTSEKIENLCYSNNFKIEFNSINQLTNYLKHDVKNILFKNAEYFLENDPFLRKDNHLEHEIDNLTEEVVLSEETGENDSIYLNGSDYFGTNISISDSPYTIGSISQGETPRMTTETEVITIDNDEEEMDYSTLAVPISDDEEFDGISF